MTNLGKCSIIQREDMGGLMEKEGAKSIFSRLQTFREKQMLKKMVRKIEPHWDLYRDPKGKKFEDFNQFFAFYSNRQLVSGLSYKEAIKECEDILRIREEGKRIRDVKTIMSGATTIARAAKELELIVEEPCLEVCRRLYGYNIQILASSGSMNTCIEDHSRAYVSISYDNLSEKNKEIVDRLVDGESIVRSTRMSQKGRLENQVSFYVPIKRDSAVFEVRDTLYNLCCSHMRPQDILYGKSEILPLAQTIFNDQLLNNGGELNMQEACRTLKELGVSSSAEEKEIEKAFARLIHTNGYGYYDETEDTLWDNERLYEKHRKYIESLTSDDPPPIDYGEESEMIEPKMSKEQLELV